MIFILNSVSGDIKEQTIKLNTLEDLIELISKHKEDIIVYVEKDKNYILIYDGYIE